MSAGRGSASSFSMVDCIAAVLTWAASGSEAVFTAQRSRPRFGLAASCTGAWLSAALHQASIDANAKAVAAKLRNSRDMFPPLNTRAAVRTLVLHYRTVLDGLVNALVQLFAQFAELSNQTVFLRRAGPADS